MLHATQPNAILASDSFVFLMSSRQVHLILVLNNNMHNKMYLY